MNNPFSVGKKPASHLEFRRYIFLCLLKAEQANERLSESLPGLPAEAKLNHLLGSTTQGRCKICKKNTKNVCVKCDVRLYADWGKLCFKNYHDPKALCK